MRIAIVLAFLSVLVAAPVSSQELSTEPALVRCPSVLGVGVESEIPFCDVQVQVDPELGVQVELPPRQGEATLSFNLHARHAYSQREAESGRAFTQYLASVAIATMEGEIIGRGAVLSVFRTAADLVDRVSGGAGPSGLKAVAPTGWERVYITIPLDLERVVIVGQKLDIIRIDGRDSFTDLGRPVAVLSEARLKYQPE